MKLNMICEGFNVESNLLKKLNAKEIPASLPSPQHVVSHFGLNGPEYKALLDHKIYQFDGRQMVFNKSGLESLKKQFVGPRVFMGMQG